MLGFSDADGERSMLATAWGISDRRSMITALFDLLLAGHRIEYDREIAEWSALSDAEAERVEREMRAAANGSESGAEALWRFRRVRADDRGIRSASFFAWDLMRFAMLVRAGVGAGYLSEVEGADYLVLNAGELQTRYRSWEELGESLLLGRWYWNSQGGDGEAENDEHDLSRQRALLGAGSPWLLIPWDLPIPESQMLFADAIFQEVGYRGVELDDLRPGLPPLVERLNAALLRLENR